MTSNRYIVRPETFGYTLYDRETLRHRFFLKDKYPELLEITAKHGVDHWDADVSQMRKDILYSPLRIYYEITLKCNLRCKLCYNNSGLARANELSTQEIYESLLQFRRANVFDIRFTGGELTQHPDWFEILSFAKSLGFSVSCNTNGVFQSEAIYDQFAKLALEQVTLSLDGVSDNHDAHRGANTYDKTVRALQELHARGTNLRINTLLSKWSVHDLRPMVETAAMYATEINFFTFQFSGRATLQMEQSISFDEYYQMAQEADALRSEFPQITIMHFGQAFRENSIHPEDSAPKELMLGAPDGFTRFNILSDGGMWAGGYIRYIDPSWELGNVRTDSLLNVWQSNPKLEQYRVRSMKLKQVCKQCPVYLKQCPGANYEIELYRERHPEINNPMCLYGASLPLLHPDVLEQQRLPYLLSDSEKE